MDVFAANSAYFCLRDLRHQRFQISQTLKYLGNDDSLGFILFAISLGFFFRNRYCYNYSLLHSICIKVSMSRPWTVKIYLSNDKLFCLSVPVKSVDAVIGGKAELPCDIYPSETSDDVYLVLWYRDIAGKPLYRWIRHILLKMPLNLPRKVFLQLWCPEQRSWWKALVSTRTFWRESIF